MDFASPQDVLSETFLYMSEKRIKEYNTELILKLIWNRVNVMWYKFLGEHPKFSNWMTNHAKRQKENAVRNLKKSVVVDRLKDLKQYKDTPRSELYKNVKLIEEKSTKR